MITQVIELIFFKLSIKPPSLDEEKSDEEEADELGCNMACDKSLDDSIYIKTNILNLI
jgi:hypothetical protein